MEVNSEQFAPRAAEKVFVVTHGHRPLLGQCPARMKAVAEPQQPVTN